MIHVDGVPQKISDQQATAIYRYLLKNDYIDDNEHITEQYRADLENNALAPLAEELKTMTEGIHKLIQSIFNDKILEDMIGNGNETTVPSNDLNENFAKKEFQTLWNYINHKYAYTVDFDSNELIKKAIEHIDRELFVSQLQYTVSKSERFKSKSSLSIHGIEVPYNLFPNYSNKMSKAVLNILFPFSFRLDIGVNSDLNLNSARDQIIYDEKWLTFEENLYQVICKRLKEQLSLSDWERLNEIIQKNGKNIFSRVANNIE